MQFILKLERIIVLGLLDDGNGNRAAYPSDPACVAER